MQNIFFKGIEVDIAGVQKSEETIANFQWFLRRPSPLNVFGRSDHCHQWFYDGFLMLLPSLSMVFDGSRPLVKRCDGFDGSLWSRTLTWYRKSFLMVWVARTMRASTEPPRTWKAWVKHCSSRLKTGTRRKTSSELHHNTSPDATPSLLLFSPVVTLPSLD